MILKQRTTHFENSENGIIFITHRDGQEQDEAQMKVSTMTTKVKKKKKKKKNGRKKVRGQILCLHIMSDVDHIYDGYKWRKYGQKVAKNTIHPRNYYRCATKNCRIKKQIERSMEDSRMVITTYEGTHNHAPPFV